MSLILRHVIEYLGLPFFVCEELQIIQVMKKKKKKKKKKKMKTEKFMVHQQKNSTKYFQKFSQNPQKT